MSYPLQTPYSNVFGVDFLGYIGVKTDKLFIKVCMWRTRKEELFYLCTAFEILAK